MAFANLVLLPTLGILAGMLACLELGRWVGRRRGGAAGEHHQDPSANAVDGAIFALFGLLIAFTFSSAAARYEERRALILAEANAIGTAYLRLDLLPAAAQPSLRQHFRDYVGSRLATYRVLPDIGAARAEYDRSVALQARIWSEAVAAVRPDPSPASATLVVPALNEMFDLAYARIVATRTHLPGVVLALLAALAHATALVVGYANATSPGRVWFRKLLFAFVIAVSIFVILDLEYPRLGFIRLDEADQAIEDVLEGMK